MSRRTEKRRYGKYNKFDVVYADFGKNPHGIQGGIRPGIIISCDASNHDGAPQVSVVPLSSKLKDIPVHVILNPKDVSGFGLSKISDFMSEDAQTISKGCIRAKSGTVIEDSGVREEIDRALIRQFDLLPVARKFVKRKEYSIVGKIRRNGFSQRDVDRQWNQIVNMIRKKQISGVVVANMAAISSSVADAYFKVGLVIEAGGIVVTVDEGRLDMHIKKGA